jgi:hypothetical protein
MASVQLSAVLVSAGYDTDAFTDAGSLFIRLGGGGGGSSGTTGGAGGSSVGTNSNAGSGVGGANSASVQTLASGWWRFRFYNSRR